MPRKNDSTLNHDISTSSRDVSSSVSPAFAISGEDRKYLSPELLNQIDTFLADSSIPDARKKAFLSGYSGLSSSLPSETWLDRLSTSIIGTSNYQKAMNKYGTDVGALLGQYINTDYQEDYNSAESQQARILQAGINPDISGGVDAGSSSDFDDQSNFPDAPSEVIPDGSNVLTTLTSVIQGVFGYVSAIQGIVKNGVEIENMQTNNISNENSLVRDMVLSSGYVPDTAISFDLNTEYPDAKGNKYKFVDKDGNPIPFNKLSQGQKDALKLIVDANGYANTQMVEKMFVGSGFSSNKIARLKGRVRDYLSSERFLADWYSNYSLHQSSKLSGNTDSENILMKAFDNVFTGFSEALSKSDYYTNLSKNAFDKATYDNLIKSGVPKEEAELRARKALRDKQDNLVFDEFRQQMSDILDPTKPAGKKADKWDKLFARIGLVLLYIARQKL